MPESNPDDTQYDLPTQTMEMHYRTQALARTVDLANTLGLTNDATTELVAAVRERLERADERQVEEIHYGIGRAAMTLADIGVRSAEDEKDDEPEPTANSGEITAEISDASLEPLRDSAENYLTKLVGMTRIRPLSVTDAPVIARVLNGMNPPAVVRVTNLDYESILLQIFQNRSVTDLARERGSNANALFMSLNNFVKRFAVRYTPDEANTTLFAVLAGEVAEDDITVPAIERTVMPRPAKPILSVPISRTVSRFDFHDDEPDVRVNAEMKANDAGAALSETVSRYLASDDETKTGIENYFNFNGVNILSHSQEPIPPLIERYIRDRFGTLDNPVLALDDRQKALLRGLTGAWYSATDGKETHRPPRNMASLIGFDREARLSKLTLLQSAFESIFMSDDERPPLPAVPKDADVKEQPPVRRRRQTVQWTPRPQSSGRLVRQETSASALTHDESDALYTQLSFESEGYETDNDTARAGAAKLLARLALKGPDVLGDDPATRVAVKMFVFRGLGFNNLDTIYDKVSVKDPSLTRADVETRLRAGIAELLK